MEIDKDKTRRKSVYRWSREEEQNDLCRDEHAIVDRDALCSMGEDNKMISTRSQLSKDQRYWDVRS
jgi:hypothetical protein